MLVAARALQGAFGAVLAPAALSTLVNTFTDPKDRGNLLFAARKRNRPPRLKQRNPREVDAALALITAYVTRRVRTQRAA